jgi:NTE family protein
MIPQHIISQLLESDAKYPKTLDLLKKIIITTQLGRLQINGLPPDNSISLANYLFDNENILFDFTRLSDDKRKQFTQWLLAPHQNEKTRAYFSAIAVNEYRGFTAEVFLSWWGRIKKWFNRKYSEYWQVADLNISLNYQLTGIEICHGQNGMLIGFDQFLAPSTSFKYHDHNDSQREPLGNTKRLLITDFLVEQLLKIDIEKQDYEMLCKPHPHSIDVFNTQERFNQMYDYRSMQRFLALNPWYLRMWHWIFPWSKEENKSKSKSVSGNTLILLYQSEHIQIEQYSKTHEILVKEIRPAIDDIVYCGGGAKIFGHIGFWKALNEANVRPSRFSGSSAGAIMALLCYLGYSADEISELFKYFRQDHLIHFDISLNGISDPQPLKTALDYAIAHKLKQIVEQYKIPYPEGKITFATLESIRQQCLGCGLGCDLVVTATNKKRRKTRYFSLHCSPDFEVSEAVKTSASFPIVYRSTLIDGEEHNDGAILTGFPTEAFPDDYSTLLESEYGNNLKVLAVQFDNGTERTAIDRMMDKVYRENYFVNWIYRLLTGVNDPASGWEQDRLKLRKYSSQSVVIKVDNISSSSFSVNEESRKQMIQAGYDATMSYIKARYTKDENGSYQNDELMYTKFSSLGDLLAYCCHRGNKVWFERVSQLISDSHVPNRAELMEQAAELHELYFKNEHEKLATDENPPTFFGNTVPQKPKKHVKEENHRILLAVYPVFLQLVPEFLKDGVDKKIFNYARHSLILHHPFACLEYFAKIKQPINIILHVVIKLLHELKDNPCQKIYDAFDDVMKVLKNNPDLIKEEYFARWSLTYPQCLRVLKVLNNEQVKVTSSLLNSLRIGEEPMQEIVAGVFCERAGDEEEIGLSPLLH